VVALLRNLRRPDIEPVRGAGPGGGALDARFVARQNAEAAAGAERYYRAMVRGGPASWNVRDCHMADTLDRLLVQYGAGEGASVAKAVVWEHNTHVGDARATDMAAAGMVNLGQLARERHGRDDVVLVGFATHRGGVVASPRWGGPVCRMTVPPARPGSLEDVLHEAMNGEDAVFVLPKAGRGWSQTLRDHRAIGVVYRPEVERRGNYVPTVLGDRYDAFLWCDRTEALRPLHEIEEPDVEPETYPSGV
jgi:erythromycin esterase